MNRASVRLIVVVCVAGVCALPGAGAAAARAAQAAHPTALPDCLGVPKARPAAVVFACGDGNFGARRLRWTGWGEAFAAATGVAWANDCTPNCAAGRFHTYQAVVVAAGSQRCSSGIIAYRRITIAFVGPSPYPKAKPSDLTYPARCR